ncbi:MAG: rRNA maturation RNase YbeY [Syntrophales bacterium]
MTVSLHNKQKKETINKSRLRRSLKRLLKELKRENGEVSVLIVDDEQIQAINRDYLDRDRPTNVISFAMTEGEGGNIHPEVLGDIIISAETAARDAACAELPLMDELEFLLIHGILHLLGYNHENTLPEEVARMKVKEDELFFLLRNYRLD